MTEDVVCFCFNHFSARFVFLAFGVAGGVCVFVAPCDGADAALAGRSDALACAVDSSDVSQQPRFPGALGCAVDSSDVSQQ